MQGCSHNRNKEPPHTTGQLGGRLAVWFFRFLVFTEGHLGALGAHTALRGEEGEPPRPPRTKGQRAGVLWLVWWRQPGGGWSVCIPLFPN